MRKNDTYTPETDKLVMLASTDGSMEIYPCASRFFGTKEIELNIDDETIKIPVHQIDNAIEGLRLAKRKAEQKEDVFP